MQLLHLVRLVCLESCHPEAEAVESDLIIRRLQRSGQGGHQHKPTHGGDLWHPRQANRATWSTDRGSLANLIRRPSVFILERDALLRKPELGFFLSRHQMPRHLSLGRPSETDRLLRANSS